MKKLLLPVISMLGFALVFAGPEVIPLDPNAKYHCYRANNSFSDSNDKVDCGTFAAKDWQKCRSGQSAYQATATQATNLYESAKKNAQKARTKALTEAARQYPEGGRLAQMMHIPERAPNYTKDQRQQIDNYEKAAVDADNTYKTAVKSAKDAYDAAVKSARACSQRKAWILTDNDGKVYCGTCRNTGEGGNPACAGDCKVAQ